ncbi:glycosyl hydrolase family 61-domain-containing protein [Xylaria sp. CBS 124048]|nr:glycosyl hydrolase family 61-domain-containing protein [Xylaria sp. CBS 124048]
MQKTSYLGWLSLVGYTSLVRAHGFISNINVNELLYDGWNPSLPDAHPLAIAWSNAAFDQSFVNPTGYTSEEIICHRDAQNANAHALISAGDHVQIQWNGWPIDHKGPMMNYLASCGENQPCEDVDKNGLRFFKISELGLLDGAATATGPGGLWASDLLIANNHSWILEIPPAIKPGFYVLRSEIVALHTATTERGAQNYPQCFNLRIDGQGTVLPDGVPGTELYNPGDPSFHLDIYEGLSTYKIPGPTVMSGVRAETIPPLSHPVPTGAGPVYRGTERTPVAIAAQTTILSSETPAPTANPRPFYWHR